MTQQESPAVVIENGSAFMKAGFSGHDKPFTVIPTVIQQTQTKRYPIEHGLITNFTDLEILWHDIYNNKLKVLCEQHALLCCYDMGPGTSSPPKKLTQIAFETFNVPKFYLSKQQELALSASGRITGIVFDSGYSRSVCTPLYDGYLLPHAINITYCGGMNITKYLNQLLIEKGYQFDKIHEFEIINKIKECVVYIAKNGYNNELAKYLCKYPQYVIPGYLRDMEINYNFKHSVCDNKSISNLFEKYLGDIVKDRNWRQIHKYKLPDNTYIELETEPFECGAYMFNNHAIHEIIYQCINKCDYDIRNDLMSNIMICGGNTMFNGIENRLSLELTKLFNKEIKVIAPSNRNYSVWIGGSILSSLQTFDTMWITTNEYNESGPSIVHRKCV